jgi:SAM-dependent methyltransferase
MESLKIKFRSFLRAITKYDVIWYLLLPFVQVAKRVSMEREHWIPAKVNEAEAKLRAVFADLRVKAGPFRGMQYPDFLAHGSYLYPKLIGSYEQELHPILERVCSNCYSEILDVGCAEGYYAVGMALRQPGAKIYAYDIDASALDSCKKMAQANGVSNRFVFEASCDPKVIQEFSFKTRGLIICDCEGYEEILFSPGAVDNLKNCDLLIELHDCIRMGITEKILNAFHRTHTATLVSEGRRNADDYQVLKPLNKFARQYALNEGRPGSMQWAYFTAKVDGVLDS